MVNFSSSLDDRAEHLGRAGKEECAFTEGTDGNELRTDVQNLENAALFRLYLHLAYVEGMHAEMACAVGEYGQVVHVAVCHRHLARAVGMDVHVVDLNLVDIIGCRGLGIDGQMLEVATPDAEVATTPRGDFDGTAVEVGDGAIATAIVLYGGEFWGDDDHLRILELAKSVVVDGQKQSACLKVEHHIFRQCFGGIDEYLRLVALTDADVDQCLVGDVENGLLIVEGRRTRKVLCIYKRNACQKHE